MIQIELDFDIQLNEIISIKKPFVKLKTSTDNHNGQVMVFVEIYNDSVTYGRETGHFNYTETWNDDDCINHITEWAQQYKIG